MSHTNSTTNYNLPQFVGTDKPTWLNDVNGAFASIDAQMKLNADSATSAGTSATTANNAIGTMASLETTAKTDLVSAVNEVNTNTTTVGNVASQASANATSALTKATEIETALNFTKFKEYNSNEFTLSNITNFNNSGFHVASNEDGTVGKVYGVLEFTISGTTSSSITFPSSLRPESNITIMGTVMMQSTSTGRYFVQGVSVAPNGNITFTFSSTLYNTTVRLQSFACLLFLKDFGDTQNS